MATLQLSLSSSTAEQTPTPEIIVAPLWGLLQPVTASPSASSCSAEAQTSWRSMLTLELISMLPIMVDSVERLAMLWRATAV